MIVVRFWRKTSAAHSALGYTLVNATIPSGRGGNVESGSPSTVDGGGNPLKSASCRDVLIKSPLPIFAYKISVNNEVSPISSIRCQNITIRKPRQEKIVE